MIVRLAIWDMDGTLVDSRVAITRAMDTAFAAVDLPAPGYERTRQIVGLSLSEACARLAPDDLSPAGLAQLCAAYQQAFIAQRAEAGRGEPLYDGAIDALERLADAGWLLGVATGKARRGVDAIFKTHDIGRHFDIVRCADDGPGKPHPFMVSDAIAALGVEATHTVVIGDTAHDVAMARAAGARALGVTWGFHTHDEIAAADPHEIHHEWDTLNAALDAFEAGPTADAGAAP